MADKYYVFVDFYKNRDYVLRLCEESQHESKTLLEIPYKDIPDFEIAWLDDQDDNDVNKLMWDCIYAYVEKTLGFLPSPII